MRHRLRFERPLADKSFRGAGSGNWIRVCECWGEVQDALPSRSEQLGEGIAVTSRPARVRVSFRADLSSEMRILIGRTSRKNDGTPQWQTDRVLQIVSGPAEIGRRDQLEFIAAEYRPAGNPA